MYSGLTVAAITWVIYGITRNLTVFLVFSVIEGLSMAWSYPARQAFLVQVSPRRWLGAVQGLESSSTQLAALVGTLLSPVLYGFISGYTIAVAGVVALLGLAATAPTLSGEWRRIESRGYARGSKGQ